MIRDKRILILGEGRISQAVFYYLKKQNQHINFLSQIDSKKEIKNFSLIISALPSKEAPRGVELALRYRKNLLDISDLDPPFYLKRKKDIERSSILVIPGCGFCPGLVNFILGRQIYLDHSIKQVFIKAGSLSPKEFFFPFLWCFDDLIAEHKLSSLQIINGRKIKLSPFSGYLKEKFFGIPAESYYSVSGFENVLKERKFSDFHFRVVRPLGFRVFFNYLDNYGLFRKDKINLTASLFQEKKENNFTFTEIKLVNSYRSSVFRIYSFSKAEEKLNSMQKITALVPVNLAELILKNLFSLKGLIFMEELGKNEKIFKFLINKLKKEISIKYIKTEKRKC